VFDLIGRHLTQAWRNARAMSRLRRQMEAMGTGAEAVNCGFVALGPGGRVSLMTPWTRNVLDEFFGTGSVGDHRIPDTLGRWVRDRKKQFATGRVPQPLDPFVVSGGESQLVVRLLIDSFQDLLVLQAHRPARDPARLASLGLTRRETEVLAWAAKGKTNGEIGDLLGASPRTVQKHLEHIFAKLGVETRTAAVVAAFPAVNPGSLHPGVRIPTG